MYHLRIGYVDSGIGGLVVWEYMLALKVITLGNRRLLSVTSTLLTCAISEVGML